MCVCVRACPCVRACVRVCMKLLCTAYQPQRKKRDISTCTQHVMPTPAGLRERCHRRLLFLLVLYCIYLRDSDNLSTRDKTIGPKVFGGSTVCVYFYVMHE